MEVRKPIFAANWKMHKTIGEATAFLDALQREIGPCADREVVVAPPFTALAAAAGVLKIEGFSLAAQNCWFEPKGAFTGEISTQMLKDAGCAYVIVGHSERRHVFGETDETIWRKTAAVLDAGMIPVLCVGELLEDRDAGRTFDVVGTQITRAVEGLDAVGFGRIVLAYEPVWAIGTGRTATPEQAQDVHAFIRGRCAEIFDEKVANGVRILYGGSVKSDNVDALIAQPDIDGMLVGGASLEVDSFKRIVCCQSVKK